MISRIRFRQVRAHLEAQEILLQVARIEDNEERGRAVDHGKDHHECLKVYQVDRIEENAHRHSEAEADVPDQIDHIGLEEDLEVVSIDIEDQEEEPDDEDDIIILHQQGRALFQMGKDGFLEKKKGRGKEHESRQAEAHSQTEKAIVIVLFVLEIGKILDGDGSEPQERQLGQGHRGGYGDIDQTDLIQFKEARQEDDLVDHSKDGP